MNQLTLINQVKELNNALTTVKPNNSETVQLVTYTLIGVALVGIAVYHYIKQQERTN